ncbi:Retrovirus-related Pol polyprotein from transposon [Ceratobasidium sp. AG-Ba]|nr:Retrovirus-related Pol polyprotein from transposon [Ceratobasidium sp. AG-Ba]QRW07723.1 Retrovirus-related Pol polyprotein from transposon [Ceratobasidium sp. AG-Ba]
MAELSGTHASSSGPSFLDSNIDFSRAVHDYSCEPCLPVSQYNLDVSQYADRVIDLCNVEGGKEVPLKIEARVVCVDGRDGGIGVLATIDGGAMLCVLDHTVWAEAEQSLGRLAPSSIVCRMANGTCIQSKGTGEAWIIIEGVSRLVQFEVLDSRGAFDLLIGKTWLRSAGACQNFADDSLILHSDTGAIVVKNQNPNNNAQTTIEPAAAPPELKPGFEPELEPELEPEPKPEPELEPNPTTSHEDDELPVDDADEHHEDRDRDPPVRRSKRLAIKQGKADLFWVSQEALECVERWAEQEIERTDVHVLEVQTHPMLPGEELNEFVERLWQMEKGTDEEKRLRQILEDDDEPPQVQVYALDLVLERAERLRERAIWVPPPALLERQPYPPSLRTTNPFNPLRVADIKSKIKIGDDLTSEQRERVDNLIGEFADIFARSLSEVLPVDFSEMRLDIPEGTEFPKKTGQRRLTEPQRTALYQTLDELEAAGIIEPVSQDQVKAVSPINMVPKQSTAPRPPIQLLQQMANAECLKYGIPVKYPEAGIEVQPEKTETQQAKWRLVQNFATVNKVTQVRPFPMGDLPAKQRWAAGKRYVSVMDLQAGFHAIPIAKESVPYTGFHVDGRGYYVYRRMPFGLTGAPTTFCEMLAKALHDMVGTHLEVWMDDIASAADDFDTALASLRLFFERCRSHKLSLSPAKSVLFMSEASFAGARVSKDGIRPDLRKVRAILEWPEPATVLEVMSFLGLVGSYRTKIRDYARVAQPLSDLTRDIKVTLDAGSRKHEYRRALSNTPIVHTDETRRAFVELKLALTSEPVVRAPVYDGRPFIIKTDGSKFGFGAVLEQEWEETDRNGKPVMVRYPIAYTSKRTSRSEERYIPFLLEFAALKFGLDEFDDIIFGQPIELETDCKALADLLGNQKLNSTHERWRESVIARDIRAVRHLPGVENKVCDALSRVYEHRPDDPGGHLREMDVDPGWEASKEMVNDLYLLFDDPDTAAILDRFKDDAFFADILQSLIFDNSSQPSVDETDLRARKRRAHRAAGFAIEEGKLWQVSGKNLRSRSKAECIPTHEGRDLALSVHSAGGHFGRDMTILALQQRYFWPTLRKDATDAVVTCPRCKNFGPRLRSAHLQPITRAKPFDLLVGDYVSMPTGHEGFKTVLLLVDVYSRYIFTFPSRKPGTGRFTVNSLTKVSEWLLTPSSFMADGGRHFDCDEVKDWAEANSVQMLKTPAYAPWTNGLAEGSVKLLIGRLKRLCAGVVGEVLEDVSDEEAEASTTPEAWPKFLAKATAQLNDRILPSLGYSPRELLTGVLKADRKAELASAIWDPRRGDVRINMGLAYAYRDDAFSQALRHAARRKKAFDKGIRHCEFKIGDLVQRYDARLDETHSSMRKLAPRWSGPLRIVGRSTNSYRLEDLQGNEFSSAAHTRLLRPFVPRPGSSLASYVDALQRARTADPAASAPVEQFAPDSLPRTPRPETRVPLDRDDPTQPRPGD